MVTTPTFLCLLLSLANWHAEAFNPFLYDIEDLFNTLSTNIIIRDSFDQDYDITHINVKSPTSFMSYTSDEDVSEIVERLLHQQFLGDLELIIFLGSGHLELLRRLVNNEKLFNGLVVGLLPEEDYTEGKLALQLNTQLYFYSWEESRMVLKLKEKYSIRGIPVENTIGNWTESAGFTVEEPRLWERRTDLMGSVVRVVSVNLAPLHSFIYEGDKDEGKIIGGEGFFIQPLNYLAEALNFTIQFNVSVDGKFGAVDRNGTWNGMIGMLVEGTTDIATAALTRTMARDSVAPFSITLHEEESTLAAPIKTTKATNVWVYVDIFDTKLTWAVLGSMFVAVAIGFIVIKFYNNNYIHGNNDSEELNLFECMGLAAFPSTMELPFNIGVKQLSSRIIFVFAGFATFVLYAHYEANLTAMMTSGPKENAIKSFHDVIKGEYKVVVEDSTSMQIFMETARPGSAMHQVYYETMENNPDSFVSGLAESVEALYENEKTLTFTSSLYDFMKVGDRLDYLNIQGLTAYSYCSKFRIIAIFNTKPYPTTRRNVTNFYDSRIV